jgi:lipopolysaccharide/colanic/teichoic acid biosynthesis glycosyltransferase
MIYRIFFKRVIDLLASSVALVVLSPIFLILSLMIRIKLGSPVFFNQDRPGLNGKIFKMYKFRTMTDERDENGALKSDSVRLTKFGRMLRSTSIDELPELINIIKGEMSLVGPRPLLVRYLPLYNDEQKHRHDVKPGLTGLAQVKGRNNLTWEKKFEYDVEYVDNMSFVGDWKIIFLTVKKVFVKEGISSDTSVTMEPFRGSAHHSEN